MKHSHIFDPAHIAVLESEDRRLWQNPDEILGTVRFNSRWIAADLGAGSGYFTALISQKVRKVYAIDVQKEMLRFLENKIHKLKLKNVELRLSNADEIPLEDQSVDFLMSVNTLHELDDKAKMIKEMKRVVKQDGRLLIVDFKKQDTGFGPPVRIRVSKEAAIKLFKENGLTLSYAKDLPYHYLLVLVKA